METVGRAPPCHRWHAGKILLLMQMAIMLNDPVFRFVLAALAFGLLAMAIGGLVPRVRESRQDLFWGILLVGLIVACFVVAALEGRSN